MKAKGYRQAKTFIRQELYNERAVEVNELKHKTGRAVSSNCRFRGFDDETTRHNVCDCEVLINKRRSTLGINFIEKHCHKLENIRGLLQFWRRVFEKNLELRGVQATSATGP